MAHDWDYAVFSKNAYLAGGPEKYVEMLVSAGKEEGKAEGKAEMLPWLGVTAVGVSLLTAATVKVVDYLKSKKAQGKQELEIAKQELIEGIKAYDEKQKQCNSEE